MGNDCVGNYRIDLVHDRILSRRKAGERPANFAPGSVRRVMMPGAGLNNSPRKPGLNEGLNEIVYCVVAIDLVFLLRHDYYKNRINNAIKIQG